MKALIFVILSFLSVHGAFGENSTSATSNKTQKTKSLLRKSYYDFSINYIVWQELIDASGTGISGQGRFSFTGTQFSLTHNRPFKNIRWVQTYSGQISLGTTKGKGDSTGFADEFKNQMWYAVSGSAGLTYRTTAASELGAFIPVYARMISWQLASNAAIELDKKTSFSVGLGLNFTQRFNTHSALQVALVHQFLWEATQWSLGYQYSFR